MTTLIAITTIIIITGKQPFLLLTHSHAPVFSHFSAQTQQKRTDAFFSSRNEQTRFSVEAFPAETDDPVHRRKTRDISDKRSPRVRAPFPASFRFAFTCEASAFSHSPRVEKVEKLLLVWFRCFTLLSSSAAIFADLLIQAEPLTSQRWVRAVLNTEPKPRPLFLDQRLFTLKKIIWFFSRLTFF